MIDISRGSVNICVISLWQVPHGFTCTFVLGVHNFLILLHFCISFVFICLSHALYFTTHVNMFTFVVNSQSPPYFHSERIYQTLTRFILFDVEHGWNFSRNEMKLKWNSCATVSKKFQNSFETVLKLFGDCFHFVVRSVWGVFKIQVFKILF